MSSKFIQRGGLWVVGQSVLLFAVVISGVVFHGDGKNLPIMAGGVVFFVVAFGCGLAGKVALGRNLTPFPKPSTHTQLVQGGIYGLMRHPLYTTVFCGSVGWALFWQSWPALVVSLLLAVFFDAKARREEHWLRQQFPDYAGYERRVRRFIPWIY
jgi:protein-S-isoprenylcysteine O-methyltransferase Ste14